MRFRRRKKIGVEYVATNRQVVVFDWTVNGVGFGQLRVKRNDDDSLEVDTEAMGRDFVRQILAAWTKRVLAAVKDQ